jgi:hypothetical protein
VIPDSFGDFFLAVAGAAAALVGLLFVSISVAREQSGGSAASLADQFRASSALTGLSAPLVIALIALIPGAGIGVVAVAVGGTGLLFVTASLSDILTAPLTRAQRVGFVSIMVGFIVVMGLDLGFGIALLVDPAYQPAVYTIAGTSVASLSLGVERAWELVGGQNASGIRSILRLFRRPDR